jgi:hypothetical protein
MCHFMLCYVMLYYVMTRVLPHNKTQQHLGALGSISGRPRVCMCVTTYV